MLNVGLESQSRAVLHVQQRDLTTDQILDALDSIAAHGEVFNFFSKEELDSILSQSKFTSSLKNLPKERTNSQLLEEVR